MSITFVYDATHDNVNAIPHGALAALYTTGTPDIKATPADFLAHPNAVHIVQDHGSDPLADFIDMELGAATPEDVAIWIPKARAAFNSHARANQKWPGAYASESTLTNLANVLVANHLTNVPLWVAEWDLSESIADSEINNAGGPFPIVGMQIKNEGTKDFSVFSSSYLANISGSAVSHPVNQTGNVHSLTTGLSAKVVSNDSGFHWTYAGK